MRRSIRSSKGPLALVVLVVLGLSGMLLTAASNQSGVPAAVWSLKGNRGSDPGADFLGTSDNQPLIVKTNSAPVLTLGSSGPVEVHKAMIVHGDFSAAGAATLSGNLQAASLNVTGTATAAAINVTGTTRTGVLEITGGTDLAEPFTISGSNPIPPGAVMIIDDNDPGRLTLSHSPYDRRVAGIVSGAGGINPGVIMYRQSASEASPRVALAGRVYAQADASNGAIRPGDLLTTSALPGHVMKVTDFQKAHGAVVGKAMSSLDKSEGLVLMLVSLQ